MEYITSNNGNIYLYEPETGYISLYPVSGMAQFDNGETDYNKRKFEYLRKHFLIKTTKEACKYKLLRASDIEEAIFNTRQIIFEVTEQCNLQCHYCGYGKFYKNHDFRSGINLSFNRFISLYTYLQTLWNKSSMSGCSYLRISFYGGEPLCNFEFIKNAVDYVYNHPIYKKRIIFSMTTNAVLLDKYMEFLANNNFELLISLDGNKYNDSYRTFKDGTSSFDKVIKNISQLIKTFPDYFEHKVQFNSVMHNRNSISEADDFIFTKYGKHPLTNELNTSGVSPDRHQEFWELFHSKELEFGRFSQKEKEKYINHSPLILACKKWAARALMKDYSNNLFSNFTNTYSKISTIQEEQLPTGTCIPFSRKIFVNVNGKLYPCERIGNEIQFGHISNEGKIIINYDQIVSSYNSLLQKYITLCGNCKIRESCSICVVSDPQGLNNCQNIRNDEITEIISYFENNPTTFLDIIKNTTIV